MINFEPILRGSDLILKEPEPFAGYTRLETTLLVAAGETVELGTLVTRSADVADTDPWAVAGAASTFGNDVLVGVYLADGLGEFTTLGEGTHLVTLIVRGNIILKDKRVFDASGIVAADKQGEVTRKLAEQGIVLEKVLG